MKNSSKCFDDKGIVSLDLTNPPVVEVGIDFHFNPDPEKRPWDLPVAKPFLEKFEDSLPFLEIVRSEEISIEKRSPQGIPEAISGKISLDRVRAHDEDEQNWLEVGNDWMGYRLHRGTKMYPGFDSVLDQSLEFSKQYIQHFKPTAIRRAVLTYVDLIKIPREEGKGLELDDYFQLGIKIPDDPFGPLGGFAIRFVLPPTPKSDRLELIFATEHGKDNSNLRFQMRWQSVCDRIDSLDDDEVRNRLVATNQHLVKCFFACFTEKGLDLFKPMGL